MSTTRHRINLWLESDTAEAIEQEASVTQQSVTKMIEVLLREALATRHDAALQGVTPVLQALMREELERQAATWLEVITTLQHKEQVQYRDLLTLIVRAIHQAGIAWRLSYMVLGQTIAEAELHQIYADAEHHVQEQITRLDINGLDRQPS